VKDAPHAENSALDVPPWYWTMTAISRSPACGPAPPRSDVKLGKVCVVPAVVVVDERRSPLATVGMVGKATAYGPMMPAPVLVREGPALGLITMACRLPSLLDWLMVKPTVWLPVGVAVPSRP